MLLCLFPGVLWLWHFLYSVGLHPVSSLQIYTFVVSRAFKAGAASQAGGAVLPGTWSHLWFAGVRECPSWCSIVGATVTIHHFFCILLLTIDIFLLTYCSHSYYITQFNWIHISVCLSLNLYDTPGLAPRMNVLFWGPGDFPVSYSNRDTLWNAWNLHSGSFMVDTGILLSNME